MNNAGVYGLHISKFETTLQFIMGRDGAQTWLYVRKNKGGSYEH